MNEPTIVYEVAVFEYEGPDQRLLFTNREAAEAYAKLLPGADIVEVGVRADAPHRLTVHHFETWVMPDGTSVLPKPPYLRHGSQECWSHHVWPEPETWTAPGSHHHRTLLTVDPHVVVLETWGYDQRATRDAHLDEAQRLRKELADA